MTVRLSAERFTLVEIGLDPLNSAKVVLLMVAEFSTLEKVSVTTAEGPTAVALFDGVTLVTVGAVVSVPAAVVNVKLVLFTVLPAKSRMYVL